MKLPRTRLTLSMAIAGLLSIPASAAAAEEAVVPPSNSAAAQYTEAFPTPGGDKKTDQAAHNRSPIKVLGSQKTKKLEAQGPAGKAAAEVAASTAPTSIAPSPDTNPATSGGGGNQPGSEDSGGVSGGGDGHNGGSGTPEQATDSPSQAETAVVVASDQDGSSGISSTIGAATGLSAAGSTGPLLPLIIIATVLWSLAYFWRQRQRVE